MDAERKAEAYMQECRGDVIIMFLEKASYEIQRILRVQKLLIDEKCSSWHVVWKKLFAFKISQWQKC